MKRHFFKISIGDWSGDGHGDSETFMASSTKPIKDVREGYFNAKERYPRLAPESFCESYEDTLVPVDVADEIEKLGGPTTEGLERHPREEGFRGTAEYMAAVTVWFLNIGDRGLDVRLEAETREDTLHFYGYDEKKRHIGFIGYGVTGD